MGDILAAIGGRTGHFRLESGLHGALWLELDRLFVDPARVRRLSTALAERLVTVGPELVCGPLAGGAFVAQQVAEELGAGFVYTDRSGPGGPSGGDSGGSGGSGGSSGSGGSAASGGLYAARYHLPLGLHEVVRGRRVVVVDDVVSAGSAVRATTAALRGAGAEVVGVGALVALGDRTPRWCSEQHLPLAALEHAASELWTPAECPRCVAGEPLETP
jgi:orotate phosphoribosyltransferase